MVGKFTPSGLGYHCFDASAKAATSINEAEDLKQEYAAHSVPLQIRTGVHCETHQPPAVRPHDFSGTLAEFVKRKFVPEYVAPRKLAGRSHFQFILRHVLTPRDVAQAFGISAELKEPSLRSIPDWPYLGSLPLQHIDAAAIQRLTSTALKAGYSTQTAVHIRNVIRSIFAHALRTNCFVGENPASFVVFPAMARKNSRSLTIVELRQVMRMMRYPEKPIALFAVLTDMNLSEICGLQWRCVNLANHPRQLETELLPPGTIAVRSRSYRGEFSPVVNGRRRSFPISNLLFSVLSDLRSRDKFSNLQDFVFASRRGTPISPENVGTRKLKAVGKVLDIPWLSWSTFHRTRLDLKTRFGQRMDRELEQTIPIHESANAH
jgi:integrase